VSYVPSGGTIQVPDSLWGEVRLDFEVRDAAGNVSVVQSAFAKRRANITLRLVQLSNAGAERNGCGGSSATACDSKSGRQLKVVITGRALPPAVALYMNDSSFKTYTISGASTIMAPICPSVQSCSTLTQNSIRKFQVISGTTDYTNSAASGLQYMKIDH
jgi:hypothetical protein